MAVTVLVVWDVVALALVIVSVALMLVAVPVTVCVVNVLAVPACSSFCHAAARVGGTCAGVIVSVAVPVTVCVVCLQ